jgi:hypothetical protein
MVKRVKYWNGQKGEILEFDSWVNYWFISSGFVASAEYKSSRGIQLQLCSRWY